jgi:elongator complex protein 6
LLCFEVSCHEVYKKYVDFYVQGLDLDKVAAKKRFTFIDGLSGLFLPSQGKAATTKEARVLNSPRLSSVSEEIKGAIQTLKNSEGGGRVFLIIDQLDLLLAAGGADIGPVDLQNMLVELQEVRLL